MKIKLLKITTLLTIGIVFSLSYYESNTQTLNDSCFALLWKHDPDNLFFNPDSVIYDSCKAGYIFDYYDKNQVFPSQYFYAQRWFEFCLPQNALYIPEVPRDSIIEKKWTDISSSFTELRQGLELLENTFGDFFIRKSYPDNIDTSSLGSRSFQIRFSNYVNIDSVGTFLKNIQDIQYSDYSRRYGIYPETGIIEKLAKNKITYRQTSDKIIIYINDKPINTSINVYIYDLLGNIVFQDKKFMSPNQNNFYINTNVLKTGFYILRIENKTTKLIINR